MPERQISVRSENPIPDDVLVEHIAVALRDFKFAGKVDVQMAHPFDDPTNVVFDDVKEEEYTGPNSSGTEYILSAEQIDRLGGIEAIRKLEDLVRSNPTVTGTHAGGGFLPADPYPLVTRALDALQGRIERTNG